MQCASSTSTFPRLSTDGYNQRLQRCKAVDSGWLEALRLLKRMKGRVQSDIVSFNTVITACEGRWEQSLQVIEASKSEAVEADAVTLSAGIGSCRKASEWKKAMQLMVSLDGVKADIVVYNFAIAAIPSTGVEVKFLEELRCEALQPTVVTFGSLAASLSHWREALQLMKETRSREVRPSSPLRNSVLKVLGQSHHWEAALNAMQTSVQETILPNTISFNTVMSGQTWQEASELLSALRRLRLPHSLATYGMYMEQRPAAGRSVAAGWLQYQLDHLHIVDDTGLMGAGSALSSMDITLPWRSQRALPLVPACQTHVQLPGGAPRVATLATLTALGCYRKFPSSSRKRESVTLRAIQYSDRVFIGGRPASLWSSGVEGETLSSYRYSFSARKLALSTLGLPLGSQSEVELPRDGLLYMEEPAVKSRAVVLVHGLLCSRLDMAHFAEELVLRGFTVLAPEMDDSVSHEDAVVPGGFVGSLLAREDAEERRLQVLQECVDWLQKRGAKEVGLVGHSRGGVTISQLEGDFCRVNIAGFQPPQVDPEDTFRENAKGPMLIICGTEDEVCTRPPLSMDYVQETVQRLRPNAESFYPNGVTHFNLLNPQVVESWKSLLGLLGALAPAPEPAAAQRAFQIFQKTAGWHLEPNVMTVGSTLTSSSWEHAQELLLRTLQSGMQPDDVSWEALMLAQGKGRRWEMAAMNPVRILGVLGDQRPSIRLIR
eukprot:symbB.v1.2.011937.t1/scaffold814.1/size160240/7